MKKISPSIMGFTMVELVITICIIGVLASVIAALINPFAQFRKARDAKRKAEIQQINAALEQYRADAGGYPVIGGGSVILQACNTPFKDPGNTVSYIQKFPCDPNNAPYNGGNYVYVSTATTYSLVACLENAMDPDGIDASLLPAQAPTVNCASNKYYMVSNP